MYCQSIEKVHKETNIFLTSRILILKIPSLYLNSHVLESSSFKKKVSPQSFIKVEPQIQNSVRTCQQQMDQKEQGWPPGDGETEMLWTWVPGHVKGVCCSTSACCKCLSPWLFAYVLQVFKTKPQPKFIPLCFLFKTLCGQQNKNKNYLLDRNDSWVPHLKLPLLQSVHLPEPEVALSSSVRMVR